MNKKIYYFRKENNYLKLIKPDEKTQLELLKDGYEEITEEQYDEVFVS